MEGRRVGREDGETEGGREGGVAIAFISIEGVVRREMCCSFCCSGIIYMRS